ncbi:MAG: hypothetical protein NC311_05565 [Muribaculaceae bacterium]|nr:hypothetical protein [Muribaculaceae bacterium]
MGENIYNGDGVMELTVNHHEYPHVATAFAIQDMEYIRKRVNANRNHHNSVKTLSSVANRTYESMKTLIDVIEVICNSGAGVFEVVPDVTTATVNEGKFAQIVTDGVFRFPDSSEVKYNITATFSQYQSGKEMYTVQYVMEWDDDASPSGSGGDLTWTDTYSSNENEILGYSENFPAPSIVAGKIAENLLVTVKEIWRTDEDAAVEGDDTDGSGMDETAD